jgi:hypothetical protein
MLLVLIVLALLAAALVLPAALQALRSRRGGRARRTRHGRSRERLALADPGRERRAEQRARELLRSCVNEEEWAMYRDLGFIRVLGRATGSGASERGAPRAVTDREAGGEGAPKSAAYAYLLYPHKPILAYEPETHRLLSEYCVEFPDLSDSVTGSRLPDTDDVLAKWMALTDDETRLLRDANMHLPGRQLDPGRVRRDLWRLGEWERRRRSADASSR